MARPPSPRGVVLLVSGMLGGSIAPSCTFHLPAPVERGAGTEAGGSGGPGVCAAPASHAPIVLADLESGVVPRARDPSGGLDDEGAPRAEIIRPGAAGTSAALRCSFEPDGAFAFERPSRREYLATASSRYDPAAANAIELQLRVPAGSPLLSTSEARLAITSFGLTPDDPWVGPNASGGSLQDSEMRASANLRLDPAVAGRWARVVLTPSAFAAKRDLAPFFAGRAATESLGLAPALRALGFRFNVPARGAVELDELKLVTLAPTSLACPEFVTRSVPAGGGDVPIEIAIQNPGPSPRSYRVFISSGVGLDRQTLETAYHAADDLGGADALQVAVGASGGLGAVELFAAGEDGAKTGPSVTLAGAAIDLAGGATFRGVLVHHVTPAMLGDPKSVTAFGSTYRVRRDTLTTSVVVWDPSEPRVADPAVAAGRSPIDEAHPQPPGFPLAPVVPPGWRAADIPLDQVGGYVVTILRLTP